MLNWNAKKTFVKDILFDVKGEADYFMLLLADTDGEKVEVQPVIDVIPSDTVTCYRYNGTGKWTSSGMRQAINSRKR